MPSTALYGTAAELRALIGKTATDKDAILAEIIEAASRSIDEHLNKPDGFVAVGTASARYYAGAGEDYLYIDECVEITQVAVKDSPSESDYVVWAADDWLAFRGSPKWPDFNTLPYQAIMVSASGDYAIFISGEFIVRAGFARDRESVRKVPTVKVTAKWGYAVECPAQVKTAAMAQSARWWKRFQGSFDDTIVSSELGSMSFKLRGKSLDEDIAQMLTRLFSASVG